MRLGGLSCPLAPTIARRLHWVHAFSASSGLGTAAATDMDVRMTVGAGLYTSTRRKIRVRCSRCQSDFLQGTRNKDRVARVYANPILSPQASIPTSLASDHAKHSRPGSTVSTPLSPTPRRVRHTKEHVIFQCPLTQSFRNAHLQGITSLRDAFHTVTSAERLCSFLKESQCSILRPLPRPVPWPDPP